MGRDSGRSRMGEPDMVRRGEQLPGSKCSLCEGEGGEVACEGLCVPSWVQLLS